MSPSQGVSRKRDRTDVFSRKEGISWWRAALVREWTTGLGVLRWRTVAQELLSEVGPDQEWPCALWARGGQETGGGENAAERQELWEGRPLQEQRGECAGRLRKERPREGRWGQLWTTSVCRCQATRACIFWSQETNRWLLILPEKEKEWKEMLKHFEGKKNHGFECLWTKKIFTTWLKLQVPLRRCKKKFFKICVY